MLDVNKNKQATNSQLSKLLGSTASDKGVGRKASYSSTVGSPSNKKFSSSVFGSGQPKHNGAKSKLSMNSDLSPKG